MLSIIVAYDKNYGIGKDGKMPWHYPTDLKYFKDTTLGHTVAMGRRTFHSIGHPLPDRKNIVFSKNANQLTGESNISVNTNPLAFFAQEQETSEEIFIIGGREIYQLALPFVKKLYVTEINRVFDVDTYFPSVDWTKFKKKASETIGELTFIVYEKES